MNEAMRTFYSSDLSNDERRSVLGQTGISVRSLNSLRREKQEAREALDIGDLVDHSGEWPRFD